MAFFSWIAVTQNGNIKRGVNFGRHESVVINYLSQQNLTVISCKISSLPKISRLHKAFFWQQLALLLEAGILLPDALGFLHQLTSHAYMKIYLHDAHAALQEGLALSELMEYSSMWSPLEKTMIAAGEKSGQLSFVCNALATHFTEQEAFIKNIKHSLLMPVITLIFFLGVILFFFFIIVPRFERMFAAMMAKSAHTLPALTRLLIDISHIFYSWWFWTIVVVLSLGIVTLVRKKYRNILSRLPFFEYVMKLYFLVSWLELLVIQIKAGIPIPAALYLAAQVVPDGKLRKQSLAVCNAVDEGMSFEQALSNEKAFDDSFLINMVSVGKSSNSLEKSLSLAHHYYQQKLYDVKGRILLLFQPLMILVLGLLVLILVVALYAPLFTMSSLIGVS